MVLRCGGVPQNPLVSDRIKGFCDAVCTPESTSFGPDKGVLQWCRGARCAPQPTNFGPDKGVLRFGSLRCQDPCCTNPPFPLQAMSRNEWPAVLDPKITPEEHCL